MNLLLRQACVEHLLQGKTLTWNDGRYEPRVITAQDVLDEVYENKVFINNFTKAMSNDVFFARDILQKREHSVASNLVHQALVDYNDAEPLEISMNAYRGVVAA